MEGQKKRSVRTLGGIPVGFGIVSLNKKKEKICGDYVQIVCIYCVHFMQIVCIYYVVVVYLLCRLYVVTMQTM